MEEPLAENGRVGQRIARGGQVAWRGFVDWLTPPKCLSCRCDVTAGATLCLACWQLLHFIDEPVCDMMGTPFDHDEGEGALSAAAIAEPASWDQARAAVAFNDTARLLVHQLKYRDTPEAGQAMARLMQGAGRKLIAATDVMVPVPMHRWHLWRRRFNQAALLCQNLERLTGKPYLHDVLLRPRATRSQVGLTGEERRRNVRRAFAVAPERQHEIDGKTVLLVDDVRTSGATAEACARTLKDAGAARVLVLTFALVLQPVQLHIVDT